MKESVAEFLSRGGKIQTVDIPKQIVSEKELKSFYQSKDWLEARKQVLSELTHMCPVCGSENHLVVDHIKPLRYFWDLRLDNDNLQILCNDCNIEKSSIPNWTLKFHIKNKIGLESQRKSLLHHLWEKKNPKEIPENELDVLIGKN